MVEGAQMNESHFGRNLLLVIVGVLVVGYVAVSLIGFLFHFFLYLVIGALAIGGVYYLVHRARQSLTGGRQRQIRR